MEYILAKNVILANEELCDFVGPRSEELIDQAEQKLGFKLGSYLDFLTSFGAGNFGAEEIFGIISKENSSVPDAVWYTLTERKEGELPNILLVIYETGGDEVFCLDFNNIKNGEPKVVSFITGIDIRNQSFEIIADNFGELLLNLVKQEI
ncbi:hypothetical protein GCM10011409_42930 [Lentibacillus populi]|uniref:Cell wall assembly protein n=1 Tax=Lentibacillus populi TaxID=1827502 RepID=A0A9W5U239_9BACI|nr:MULTISPECIES: SMI1/KNR4 family protein [Bacillaceae]GGB61063.1 hypothetical protein GCM10011409_42930 [Lentibacillus populi]